MDEITFEPTTRHAINQYLAREVSDKEFQVIKETLVSVIEDAIGYELLSILDNLEAIIKESDEWESRLRK